MGLIISCVTQAVAPAPVQSFDRAPTADWATPTACLKEVSDYTAA